MKRIYLTKIGARSLARLLLIGFICSVVPLTFISIVLSLFGGGFEGVLINGEPATGIGAIVSGVILLVVGPFFYTAAVWIFLAPGLWIYSKFSDSLGPIHLDYVEAQPEAIADEAA